MRSEDATGLAQVGPSQAPLSGESALFDAAFYRRIAGIGDEDAYAHYLREGVRRGLKPNPVFDPKWYVAQNPDAAGADPLLHYALVGEAGDRDPSPLFDVAWYRRTYGAAEPLAHYLNHRFGPFSPVPEFDAAFYLQTYPDVGEAGLDPFQHYLLIGFREFRLPFEGFDPRAYALTFMRGVEERNPVVHMRLPPGGPQRSALRPAGPHAAVRRFSRPGPGFETPERFDGQKPRALTLAFYLPQFHRIPENDAFWGAGFTEWTTLARGQPRFEGHYQPRIPGELGFYDLTNPDVLRAQAALARGAGVGAFVFYHYDFGGKRLLQAPVEQFLKATNIDIGFCLMWANENWTRRWDGAEDDVLIAQDYSGAHEEARLKDFARHFRDPRYLRLDGRPVLMVYRASLIPEAATTLARWRRRFFETQSENPIFVMAQCFDDVDPRPLGFDAAIEFPPHKLTKGLPQVFDRINIFDAEFGADVFAYDHLVDVSLSQSPPDFPLIKTAVPGWDNDARRQGKGLTLVGATPSKFERWLSELVERAPPVFGRPVVAVNAWNEWSEAAYLEPDVHYGAAYLNAAGRAAFGRAPAKLTIAALGGPVVQGMAGRLADAFGVGVAVCASPEDARGCAAALAEEAGDIAALAGLNVRTAYIASTFNSRAAALAAVVVADRGAGLASPATAPIEEEADKRQRALFVALFPEVAKVSVFVTPARGPRLASLFGQTHPFWELGVLDADDAALDEIEAQATTARRDMSLVHAASPGAAWRHAAETADGDFVWILDGAGRSEPRALTRLVAPLAADPACVFAFCEARRCDGEGKRLYARPSPLDASSRPLVDVELDAAAFAKFAAAPVAALWRRDALRRALAAVPDADPARLAAAALAAPDARGAFIAEDLEFTATP